MVHSPSFNLPRAGSDIKDSHVVLCTNIKSQDKRLWNSQSNRGSEITDRIACALLKLTHPATRKFHRCQNKSSSACSMLLVGRLIPSLRLNRSSSGTSTTRSDVNSLITFDKLIAKLGVMHRPSWDWGSSNSNLLFRSISVAQSYCKAERSSCMGSGSCTLDITVTATCILQRHRHVSMHQVVPEVVTKGSHSESGSCGLRYTWVW